MLSASPARLTGEDGHGDAENRLLVGENVEDAHLKLFAVFPFDPVYRLNFLLRKTPTKLGQKVLV